MNLEEALEAEIGFWQSLIDRQLPETPAEVLERMVQARKLAEQKLALLHRDGPVGAQQVRQ